MKILFGRDTTYFGKVHVYVSGTKFLSLRFKFHSLAKLLQACNWKLLLWSSMINFTNQIPVNQDNFKYSLASAVSSNMEQTLCKQDKRTATVTPNKSARLSCISNLMSRVFWRQDRKRYCQTYKIYCLHFFHAAKKDVIPSPYVVLSFPRNIFWTVTHVMRQYHNNKQQSTWSFSTQWICAQLYAKTI
jgi:hypothetical protein